MTESELVSLRVADGCRVHPLEGSRACISPLLTGGRRDRDLPARLTRVADGFNLPRAFFGFEEGGRWRRRTPSRRDIV
jgi:hypothetical protein